jgi:hypothetical protein
MSSSQRGYLREQGVGSGIFNFVLNGLIAWLMFRGQATVPLFGQQSIAGDTIGTCFFLPLLTCLIATRIVRGHVRAGKVAALGWSRASQPILRWLPAGTFVRGLVLAAACIAVFATLTIALLAALGVAEMSLWHFLAFKASFAALLAAIVTPVIALWAFAEDGAVVAPATVPS